MKKSWCKYNCFQDANHRTCTHNEAFRIARNRVCPTTWSHTTCPLAHSACHQREITRCIHVACHFYYQIHARAASVRMKVVTTIPVIACKLIVTQGWKMSLVHTEISSILHKHVPQPHFSELGFTLDPYPHSPLLPTASIPCPHPPTHTHTIASYITHIMHYMIHMLHYMIHIYLIHHHIRFTSYTIWFMLNKKFPDSHNKHDSTISQEPVNDHMRNPDICRILKTSDAQVHHSPQIHHINIMHHNPRYLPLPSPSKHRPTIWNTTKDISSFTLQLPCNVGFWSYTTSESTFACERRHGGL